MKLMRVRSGLYSLKDGRGGWYLIERVDAPDRDEYWWVLKRIFADHGDILHDTNKFHEMRKFVNENINNLGWMQ